MKDFILLFRPWSYVATLVPFLLAAALCGREEGASWIHWSVGLLIGLAFQVAVNLLNTWGDERSGVDSAPGAIRTTPQLHDGKVSERTVLAIALGCLVWGAIVGVAVCFRRVDGRWMFCWPLLAIGLAGALGALNYSTGLKFKYHGLGVPFVSVLMGVLETIAAELLLLPQAMVSVLPTVPIALLIGAVMHGNDMRDLRSDGAAGIRTMATVLGSRLALGYYGLAHLASYCIAVAVIGTSAALLLLVPLPLTVWTLGRAVRTYRVAVLSGCREFPPWRRLERHTGAVLFVFGVAYSMALVMR